MEHLWYFHRDRIVLDCSGISSCTSKKFGKGLWNLRPIWHGSIQSDSSTESYRFIRYHTDVWYRSYIVHQQMISTELWWPRDPITSSFRAKYLLLGLSEQYRAKLKPWLAMIIMLKMRASLSLWSLLSWESGLENFPVKNVLFNSYTSVKCFGFNTMKSHEKYFNQFFSRHYDVVFNYTCSFSVPQSPSPFWCYLYFIHIFIVRMHSRRESSFLKKKQNK